MTSVAKLKLEELKPLEAKSKNQQKAIDAVRRNCNTVLSGSAGTGKTFLALRLAIEKVVEGEYKKLIIVRSVVPTRDIGFLPGTEEEKSAVYLTPYKALFREIFKSAAPWERLVASGQVEFETTSFIRGVTWNDSIVVVDEAQNCTWHELSSVLTRLGDNSTVIVCGDTNQCDLSRKGERTGLGDLLNVSEMIPSFETVEFNWSDIVRSDFVRQFIIASEQYFSKKNASV